MKNNGTFGLIDDLILRGDTTLLWRFGGGYVELNANGTPTSWNYYITDHLGSTRMVVDSNDNIRETISYYPFGSEMRMENPALLTGGISHPFRFTGKELDRLNGLNMYDFGARWYDVAGVPMWTSIDPLCEKYYNLWIMRTVPKFPTYDVRGWLTSITGTGFSEQLFYTDGPGTPCYNGNISSLRYTAGTETICRGYRFSYDNLNRLTTATYGEQSDLTDNSGHYTEQVTSYSPNSAITALKRYGKMQNNNFGLIDDLTMTLNGNQITQIADAATPVLYSGSFGFHDNTVVTNNEYGYDDCGAMTWDANKGIAKIDYDLFGMPKRIQFTNGHVTEHVYTSEGEKLKTIHRTAVPNISISLNSTLTLNGSNTLSVDSTDYIGSFVFEQGALNKYLFAGGYFTLSGGTPVYHYYTPDHLGNNRAVIKQDGTIEQITHYYPFGGIIADLSSGQDVQPYKYNGKELDRMHGLDWYDYGARNYDAAVGSWPTMDPLAEKYYSMSPYNYCGNNPIKYIDINGDSIIVDNYGNLIGQNGKDKNVYLYSKKSNKYSKIGVLGGTIDVQKILPNALRKNASEARKLKKNLFADFAFIQKVKTGGDWDLKKNDKTIFGIDNKTRFLFNNSLMSGEDIGNMNYGVVSKAFGYSEEYAKRGAGLYQIIEGHSKPEWRSNRTSITSYRANQFGIVSSITISVIGPPYGDDPHDQYWIDQGYQFK